MSGQLEVDDLFEEDEETHEETTEKGGGDSSEDVEQLKQYRKDAQVLMKSTSWTPEVEEATRRVMRVDGFSEQEIDQWIQNQKAATQKEEEEPKRERRKNVKRDEDEMWRKEMQEREEERARVEVERMDLELGDEIQRIMSGETDLRRVLDKLDSLDEDGKGNEKRRRLIEQELRNTSVDVLRRRRAKEGRFSPTWVRDAAREAAKEVGGKYRAVIGDPDKLGRAPETVAGWDGFRLKEPVKEPEFQDGMSVSDAVEASKGYTSDALKGVVAEMLTKDKSRL